MKPGFSLSLDVVRFAAAIVVFVAHIGNTYITGELLHPVMWSAPFAHHAVIVFFVLSGLVIAYVASERENTPHGYIRARLVRLYSVVLPMLVLVPVLDWIGARLEPALYDGWWYRDEVAGMKVFAALFFLHEVWWKSVWYFSNGPYWSIAYEFWYYVAFGAMYFLRGSRRALALLAIVAVAGPKIFLLFPVWLLGVGVWHFCARRRLPPFAAAACLVGSAGAYIFFVTSGLYLDLTMTTNGILGELGFETWKLYWSGPWLAYYMVGLMVAVAFVSIASLSHYCEKLLSPASGVIRWAAGATFTIYLMHLPLTLLVASAIPGDAEDPARAAAIFVITLVGLFAIAEVTERRKHAFGAAYDYLAARVLPLLRRAFNVMIPAEAGRADS